MAIGRWVMACIGNSSASTMASSKGAYQKGSGSKKRSTRARCISGGGDLAMPSRGKPEPLQRLG